MPAQRVPTQWADCDELRTQFTLQLSAMYKSEVPLYGTLVQIVDQVNSSVKTGALDDRVLAMRFGDASQPRLNVERHGAVRVGTIQELRTIAAVFRLLGLFPVGYYDLSISEADLPMHATCFRPINREALQKNPFRIFTSVLRPELIKSPDARALATQILQRREIFSPDLLSILKEAASQGDRLTVNQSTIFLRESLKIFEWRGTTTTTEAEYQMLRSEHPVLSDIACFSSCHINHLTPRTLDITAAQASMKNEGLQTKDRIEGPPPRQCPILLRQTSFLAVEESIKFRGRTDDPKATKGLGLHRARFGEIEERGAAVTPLGRSLYDALMDQALRLAREGASTLTSNGDDLLEQVTYDECLARVFSEYPDTWDELRRQRLIYFRYECSSTARVASCTPSSSEWPTVPLDQLVESGVLGASPITYEDFLPLSAAGIFHSNLGRSSPSSKDQQNSAGDHSVGSKDVEGLENAIGRNIMDADDLYRMMEEKSINACSQVLGIIISF